ncbi:MAG: adenosylhomocysteinase [Bacillota bacterium]|jgi:adenosylhomocysteinase|nr:adenosylhomocysteinase [Bacillota bacterium]MDD3297263.1 adenosylhomocysteinase [Bacillota bacterium]MDD3850473.1 adenosylhomocysteinase [Bacillota bacterium]MDD4708034.1 adenosylhomocysteinase [Bacillota bacterium]
MESIVRDIGLAESGRKKIEWADNFMPVLNGIKKEYEKDKPFKGIKVAISVHLEAKTAYLALVLKAGGAQVHITGSNPLSTQDDVAAALAAEGLNVYAWHGSTPEEYRQHIQYTLSCKPEIVIDDGGDLIHMLHTQREDLRVNVIGGCEETTTGVLRLRAMEEKGDLKVPMLAVNNAYCKHLFDNRYGTGQSVWDGIMRTTNLQINGKTVVVAGYGWCGKGVAARAEGLGARVIVCEVDPIRALEAAMDGHSVMAMEKAAPLGDFFVTVTGCSGVIGKNHFPMMKDGAVLANAGHFNVEIDVESLEEICTEKTIAKPNIDSYGMKDGKKIFLLGEGRLVNLAAGDGHPIEIMDMSFGIQALAAKYVLENRGKLLNKVYEIPADIDRRVALMKLKGMGISLDSLSSEQVEYLHSWK